MTEQKYEAIEEATKVFLTAIAELDKPISCGHENGLDVERARAIMKKGKNEFVPISPTSENAQEIKNPKQQFLMRSEAVKHNAIRYIHDLPVNEEHYLIVKIEERTRSNDQNAKLWAMLTDISKQVIWYGKKLSRDSWKHIFTASIKKQETVPGIDGGFVVLGYSTSKMKVGEFRDLIELIYAFGAERDVNWSEESIIAKRWAEQAR